MTASSKGVIWDFDGVLVASDEIKWRTAWHQATKGVSPALLAAIRGIVQTGEGRRLSRHEVVKRALAVLSELGIAPRIAEPALVQRYGDAVFGAIVESGPRRGAIRALAKLQSAGITQFLLSGTPQKDLEKAATALGLMRYFTEVHGGTSAEKPEKAAALKKRFPAIRHWYAVGDQDGDIEMARAVDATFIGVRTKHNAWGADTAPFLTVPEETISDIPKIVMGHAPAALS